MATEGAVGGGGGPGVALPGWRWLCRHGSPDPYAEAIRASSPGSTTITAWSTSVAFPPMPTARSPRRCCGAGDRHRRPRRPRKIDLGTSAHRNGARPLGRGATAGMTIDLGFAWTALASGRRSPSLTYPGTNGSPPTCWRESGPFLRCCWWWRPTAGGRRRRPSTSPHSTPSACVTGYWL